MSSGSTTNGSHNTKESPPYSCGDGCESPTAAGQLDWKVFRMGEG